MTESRRLLQHFLAALAYRTQKALRDAPRDFADFRAGQNVRTPSELVRHMTSVIGYARTTLHGGTFEPAPLPTFAEEIARFHETLAGLQADFADAELHAQISDEQFLQGPLSDASSRSLWRPTPGGGPTSLRANPAVRMGDAGAHVSFPRRADTSAVFGINDGTRFLGWNEHWTMRATAALTRAPRRRPTA